MADGDTHRYDSGFYMSPQTVMTERQLSAFSRVSSKDDVYRGFFIPKGQTPINCMFCFSINRLV